MIGFISGHIALLRKRIFVIWGVKFAYMRVDWSRRRPIAQVAHHPRFSMLWGGAMMKSFAGFCHVLLSRGWSESFVGGDSRIFRVATYTKIAILSHGQWQLLHEEDIKQLGMVLKINFYPCGVSLVMLREAFRADWVGLHLIVVVWEEYFERCGDSRVISKRDCCYRSLSSLHDSVGWLIYGKFRRFAASDGDLVAAWGFLVGVCDARVYFMENIQVLPKTIRSDIDYS